MGIWVNPMTPQETDLQHEKVLYRWLDAKITCSHLASGGRFTFTIYKQITITIQITDYSYLQHFLHEAGIIF